MLIILQAGGFYRVQSHVTIQHNTTNLDLSMPVGIYEGGFEMESKFIYQKRKKKTVHLETKNMVGTWIINVNDTCMQCLETHKISMEI